MLTLQRLSISVDHDFDRIWQALQQLQRSTGGSIADHVQEADPHTQYLTDARAGAKYLTTEQGNKRFAAIGGTLSRALSDHRGESDPHPGYLTSATPGAGGLTTRIAFTQSGTFTVPAGVSRLRVTVAGAGGGGGGAVSGNRASSGVLTKGGDGGDSSFLGAKAFGGKGGHNAKNTKNGLGDENIPGIQWATTAGTEHGQATGGAPNIAGGGGAGGLGAKEAGALENFVSGDGVFAIGQAGGNGGLAIADIVHLVAGTTIPVMVGAGGAGDVFPGIPLAGGQSGTNDYVIVEY